MNIGITRRRRCFQPVWAANNMDKVRDGGFALSLRVQRAGCTIIRSFPDSVTQVMA